MIGLKQLLGLTIYAKLKFLGLIRLQTQHSYISVKNCSVSTSKSIAVGRARPVIIAPLRQINEPPNRPFTMKKS